MKTEAQRVAEKHVEYLSSFFNGNMSRGYRISTHLESCIREFAEAVAEKMRTEAKDWIYSKRMATDTLVKLLLREAGAKGETGEEG